MSSENERSYRDVEWVYCNLLKMTPKELQDKINRDMKQEMDDVPVSYCSITFNAYEILKSVDKIGKQATIKRVASDFFQISYVTRMIDDLLSKS